MPSPVTPSGSRPAARARIAPAQTSRSPWVYVAAGCGVLAVVGIVGLGLAAWYGYRTVNQFTADLKDPVARAAKVKQVLGYDEVPPGYHPGLAISVPMVMEMALLADREFGRGGQVQSGFLYVHVISDQAARAQMRDYMAGTVRHPSLLMQSKVAIDTAEVLNRGQLTLGSMQVTYTSQRGSLSYSGIDQRGLQGVTLLECPGDERVRFGVWFTPDPGAGADLSETPGDPEALRAFLGHFNLCRT